MIKKILISLAFVSSITSATLADPKPNNYTPVESVKVDTSIPDELSIQTKQMFDPVVQINGNCSGTIISSEYSEIAKKVVTVILTAKHCTTKYGLGELIEVEKSNYEDTSLIGTTSYLGNVFLKSNQYDLAAIVLKDSKNIFPVAKVAPADTVLRFGQPVWAVGYPQGKSLTFTSGTLGMKEYLNDLPTPPSGETISVEGEFQRSTASINPGSSGGPLFTKDSDGNYVLIGTASMMTGKIDFMAYYTTIEQINSFINKGL